MITPQGVSWWQDWMDHAEPGDPWWEPIDYGAAAQTLPPTVMVAGWYDIFLPWQLRDFAALSTPAAMFESPSDLGPTWPFPGWLNRFARA